MKLTNNKYLLTIFIVLFILWSFSLKETCSCNNKYNGCVRLEIYGVQLNHFVLFLFLGVFFPDYFFTFLLLGILWEIYEYILHLHPNFVHNYIGGCLGKKERDQKSGPLFYSYVYRDEEKYYNPIDRFFGIKNSTIHGWHHSAAEIVPNVLGFIVGSFLSKHLIKN